MAKPPAPTPPDPPDEHDALAYEAMDLSGLTPEQRHVFDRLTAPFRPDEIELLPKPWEKEGKPIDCTTCGGRHLMGAKAPHLSYVGHAGMTMRLIEVDPKWKWTPLHPDIDDRALAAIFSSGMDAQAMREALEWLAEHSPPKVENGGIWIRLNVAGFTAIGFGDADGKTGSPRDMKIMIGDAIRNAAMRLGSGTYLWSKSERARNELARQGQDADGTDQPARRPRGERKDEQPADGEDPWEVKPLTEEGLNLLTQALMADDDQTITSLLLKAKGMRPQDVTVKQLGEQVAPHLRIEGPFPLFNTIERIGQFVGHFRISVVEHMKRLERERQAKSAEGQGANS
jgi:hypothetical protein